MILLCSNALNLLSLSPTTQVHPTPTPQPRPRPTQPYPLPTLYPTQHPTLHPTPSTRPNTRPHHPTGDQVTHGKPHPEIFLKAARGWGAGREPESAAKCLVFEVGAVAVVGVGVGVGVVSGSASGWDLVGLPFGVSLSHLGAVVCVFSSLNQNLKAHPTPARNNNTISETSRTRR